VISALDRIAMSTERGELLGCPIDVVTMSEAVARAEEAITTGAMCQHVSINAAKIVKLQRDFALRHAIKGCELITADGQSVVWAGKLLGCPLPERVAGIDLMLSLLEVAAQHGYGVFLLGARAEVLERAEAEMLRRFPGLRVAGSRHGYFSPEEEDGVVAMVAEARPDLLFVALETPAKELFLARHRDRIGTPFVMGVGGSFDVLAGVRRRAPLAFRRLGLEWLYRLAQDPKRLARRYVVGNTQFILLVARERAKLARSRG
jgi:N-acetylglucosaminyldiphosphoundecaprenol N-acetyl-beta-D-mannosaminyltransferase